MNKKHMVVYVGIVVLSTVIIFLMRALFPVNAGVLKVSFLSVGEGRAVLLRTPSGATVLIDGGADSGTLRALSKELGPLQRTISMVIETNTNASNVGGMVEILNRYRIGALVTPGTINKSTASRMVALRAGEMPALMRFEAKRGTHFVFNDGVQIEALSPDRDVSRADPATGSLVLRITYGATSFLLPSDIPIGMQRWLTELDASTTLSSDVLAVGHFGAQNTLDSVWLASVRPKFVVISVGENKYGYPFAGTLENARAEGARVFTTASSTVTFISDGSRVWRK